MRPIIQMRLSRELNRVRSGNAEVNRDLTGMRNEETGRQPTNCRPFSSVTAAGVYSIFDYLQSRSESRGWRAAYLEISEVNSLGIGGFDEEVVESGCQTFRILPPHTRHHDQYGAKRQQRANFCSQGVSVAVRKAKIKDDHVWREPGRNRLDSRGRRLRISGVIPVQGQKLGSRFRATGVIINDENAKRLGHRGSAAPGGASVVSVGERACIWWPCHHTHTGGSITPGC